MAGWGRRIPWSYVVFVLVLCGIIAALIPAVRAARQGALRAQRCNNLKQIGLALHNYNDVYGMLPPAAIRDAQGRLTSSWRLRIMPFVESGNWTYSGTWSDPHGRVWPLVRLYAYCFGEGEGPLGNSETNVVAITGPGTAFDGDRTYPVGDLARGTILAIEIKDSGFSWAEPGDLDVREIPETITSGIDGDGVHVLFADGAVWFLRKDVPLDDLKKFFAVEGARRFDREQLLGPYARR